jgi:hypothetical protein
MINDLQEFIMEIIGSYDALDEIIFQARNNRIQSSREPLDVIKSIRSYSKEDVNQVRSV